MRVYHFTARHRLEPVFRYGLTKGLTPVIDGGKAGRIPGYQWLTKNPGFRQTWNEASLLPFDRTAYRIEIVIPRSAKRQLLPWPQWKTELGERMIPGFDVHGDPKNWLIFKGTVPPAWFRTITANRQAGEGGGGRRDNQTLDTKKTRLLDLCEWFIKENEIHCAETIDQTDRVLNKAPILIENICTIVGYAGRPHIGPPVATEQCIGGRPKTSTCLKSALS
jgi:hypothetical protein